MNKRQQEIKQITDEDTPMINKYGDYIYSKKQKLLLSLDKTNKKQKKIPIQTSDPIEKLK